MTQFPGKHFIHLDGIVLPVLIKKHRTSRKISLRYQPLRKSLSITLPQAISIRQGLDFANEKQQWILQQIAHYSHSKPFHDGQVVPVLGKNITLKHKGGRGTVSEDNGILWVHGDIEFMARRIQKWLMEKLKKEITLLAEKFSRRLNVKVGRITLRDNSSSWGSCSSGGNLSFSWRLVFAPYEVLEYIVAHETAHIKEHNHSDNFWKLVAQICPTYKNAENWLKRNGNSLYMYDVTSPLWRLPCASR